MDDDSFRTKYGDVLSHEGSVFVTREDGGGGEPGSQDITWRNTFEYPNRRVMEALDSDWADRIDFFRPEGGGTRWSIRWNTRVWGIKAVAQYLTFQLVSRRRLRREIIGPVTQHFGRR